MQSDTIVLVATIAALVVLGLAAAFVNIPADRLSLIRDIVGGLLVVLGASGYARISRLVKKGDHNGK
jgi:predicted tellurium resistance membrane protein TerC